MPKTLVLLSAALLLAGCGIAAKIDAREHYQQSLTAYRACIGSNGSNPKACEGQRIAMEVDERAFNNMSAAVQEGGNRTGNLIVQGR